MSTPCDCVIGIFLKTTLIYKLFPGINDHFYIHKRIGRPPLTNLRYCVEYFSGDVRYDKETVIPHDVLVTYLQQVFTLCVF